MKTLAIALLVATVALGIVVGFQYLTRARRRHLVSLHLILGTAAAWMFFLLMHAPPAGLTPPPGVAGPIAGVLLGFAVLGGLLPRLLARRTRTGAELLLAAHAIAGVAGLLVVLSWSSPL